MPFLSFQCIKCGRWQGRECHSQTKLDKIILKCKYCQKGFKFKTKDVIASRTHHKFFSDARQMASFIISKNHH